MTYENAVVVAIDDEEPDMPLLGWAAAEAAFRGTRLVVCHVCEWQPGDRAPRPMNEGGDPNLRLGRSGWWVRRWTPRGRPTRTCR